VQLPKKAITRIATALIADARQRRPHWFEPPQGEFCWVQNNGRTQNLYWVSHNLDAEDGGICRVHHVYRSLAVAVVHAGLDQDDDVIEAEVERILEAKPEQLTFPQLATTFNEMTTLALMTNSMVTAHEPSKTEQLTGWPAAWSLTPSSAARVGLHRHDDLHPPR
jgi:hypothetical protein